LNQFFNKETGCFASAQGFNPGLTHERILTREFNIYTTEAAQAGTSMANIRKALAVVVRAISAKGSTFASDNISATWVI
jgi:hypothetical protein